jgi:hypothetical protein
MDEDGKGEKKLEGSKFPPFHSTGHRPLYEAMLNQAICVRVYTLQGVAKIMRREQN